ncbi:FRG domain-containing protein [Pseudomonas aeruginosa]|uniref:FRG domain-containing protein n=1 Tax=Pseudomonas aeruginosa TaxID=287 RepID=UPI0008A4713F|nr:FRG domain-containing protein [Pseudomonas aeruginosa]MBG3952498.1 FRG domain-containing protein [Pseudomonas aeruginosa]MBI8278946.1 FRG domain-containing protein [Pseudomonas aeruginosa]MBV5643698.1 FRG domain-containing protein [Pseudomonas aeruginosa]MBV5959012.1 FRG domain-containing protein [Pseudomonas aeruginosa]MCC0322179.1 FRG domain-containing protein [Pseudomonas aeruginosa]
MILSEVIHEQQRTGYFERIPVWNDGWKCFESMADKHSGRIPVTRLESWRDYTELLESPFFNRLGIQLIFRGQRRSDWSLMPTLGRLSDNGIVTEELAASQLERFKRAIRGRLSDNSLLDEDEELWSIGQHHGLMTPLLDWTYSPYVALFFAFAKPDSKDEEENPYRVVYVLNKSFILEHQDETGIRLWEPRKDSYGRLVNQAGLFTFSPYDATIENKIATVLADDEAFEDEELRSASEEDQPDLLARYICKIYIRNEGRDACLRHLRRMNVHHASLFPDLIGASDYCNITTAEAEEEVSLARAAERERLTATQVVQVPSVPAVDVVEAPTIDSEQTSFSIEAILRAHPDAQQVEPGRIALIAGELSRDISKHQVVDWDKREDAQARMRNVIRVTLRKNGYPSQLRDDVVEQIMNAVKQQASEGK